MPYPEPVSELPEVLGRTVSLLVGGNDIPGKWNVGIDGLGFILSTLDQEDPFEFRSYELQSIPITKPRIDDQDEPGEQTLAQWWARAQHSWHEGAGQEIFDSPFSSRFKYTSSKGLDPFHHKAHIHLLKDAVEYRNDSIDDHHILGTPLAFFYTRNGNLVKDTDPDSGGETVISTHSGTLINSIASDGESLYAAWSGGSVGIRKVNMASWSGTPVVVNAHTDVDLISFVKGRLIGAKNHELFEYDLAVTTTPDPFYSDPASNWIWTGITDCGPGVYFSGYAGERSEIFVSRLTAQDIPFASVATLGALRSVWQAPEGELIHAIKGYIGQQILIGTSRGIRIATVATGEGDLQVSALVAETSQAVKCLEPQLEFGWFGWSTYDSSSSGLGRVDLGTLAYSSDLMFTSQGEVREVTTFNNRRFFVVDEGATSRIVKEHATELVTVGSMRNENIRFATTEPKVLRFFDILATEFGKWSLEIGVNGLASVPLTTENPVSGYHEEIIDLEGTDFDLEILLHRDEADATRGPTMHEWRLRADPRATGKFRYMVPVLVYDKIQTLNDTWVGEKGLAFALLNHLQDIYRSGRDFLFDPLETGIEGFTGPKEVVMEDIRFKTYTPPVGAEGFGGNCLMILRDVR